MNEEAKGQDLSAEVRLTRWDDLPVEPLNELLSRRIISGRRVMLAHVYLQKGCVVPLHQHENEQLSYVLEGSLKFWIGSENGREIVLHPGEVLHIPSNVPHKAEALEDTLDLDAFSPPREDWLNRTDDYLRG